MSQFRRRLMMMAGAGSSPISPLPAGYTQLAYAEVQPGSTAYIDTGVAASNNIGFEIDALSYDTTGPYNYGCLFGGRAGSNSSDFQLSTFSSTISTQGTLRRGGSGQNYGASIISGTRLKASLVGNTFTVNGQAVTTSGGISSGKNIYLFALNNNGTAAQHGHVRIYSFKLTDSGTIVLNYMPCVRDMDSVVGFYDLANSAFVAPTSGVLVGGNLATYDAKVEYLQSDGTQYIDTGIFGSQILGWEAHYNLDSLNAYGGGSSATIFGGRYSYNYNGLQLSTFQDTGQTHGTAQVASTLYPGLGTDSINTDYIVKLANNTIYVNGVAVKTVNTNDFLTPGTIYMFANHQQNTVTENLLGRLSELIFFNRTSLVVVADFVPVRVGSVGYMYEQKSRTLHGNIGTGNFIIGNDI